MVRIVNTVLFVRNFEKEKKTHRSASTSTAYTQTHARIRTQGRYVRRCRRHIIHRHTLTLPTAQSKIEISVFFLFTFWLRANVAVFYVLPQAIFALLLRH